MRPSLVKTSTSDSPAPVSKSEDGNVSAPSTKKTFRPAACLLHAVGLRMVKQKVYDDLIEVQEEKDEDGLLSGSEQNQLGRLRSAYVDLAKQNRPLAVRAKHRCRCGFAAGSRLELELHRDYGSVLGHEYRYSCCLCNFRNVRSPVYMAAHIENCHQRQSRVHAIPAIGFCPYCPFEQRTVAKCKLSRHVINCAVTFRIDRNLAPTAADADIPLFEAMNPPASSVQTTTAAAALSNAGSKTSIAEKAPSSSAAPVLNSGCTTVSAAGPVMTPVESPVVPSTAKIPLARLARMAPLPEGLGFEVCELCGAFVASRESLVAHLSRAHSLVLPAICLRADKPAVSCDKCTERFWTMRGLDVHIAQMHGANTEPASPPTTVCPLCKRTRLTDVLEHLARQHRITLVDMFAQRYCSVCQLTLRAARPFEHHMLTRHSDLFPDRASLYAAIVLVDRATRGRVGMVGRGRQLAVLSGATAKPSSESGQPRSQCALCLCEFANDDQLQEHVHRAHSYSCSHCGLKCSSSGYLAHHVITIHSTDTVACQFCELEVSVSEMADHLQQNHTQSCAVRLSRVEGLERKRRCGSESSDSVDSLNDDDDSELVDELQPAAKKLKTL